MRLKTNSEIRINLISQNNLTYMLKKCGCCLIDPFGAPRENCTFCSGSGLLDVIESDSIDDLTLNLQKNARLRIEENIKKSKLANEEHATTIEALAMIKKNFEEDSKKQKIYSEVKKLKLRKKWLQDSINQKHFDPLPLPGTAEYDYVRDLFVGELFKCMNCAYEANLFQDLACGLCQSEKGFSKLN